VLHRRAGQRSSAGTPLAPLLKRAGILEQGTEIEFWGADKGPLAIRDNGGVLRP
jgi:hypothetical protein